MSDPQCLSCQHKQRLHGPRGCRAKTTLEGFRDPKTGRCLCRCFVARSMTKAQSVKKINREISAAYHASRDYDSTFETRA